MKKFLGTVLAIVLASSILAGCGEKEPAGGFATEGIPTDTTPAATDATPEATDTSAMAEAAIDLTDYPVMWCQEYPFDAGTYDRRYEATAASEIYKEEDVIGTMFTGFRLIDDTHIESFGHIKLNDDIDASLLFSSLDEEVFNEVEQIRINDWETDWIQQTWTYEIDGTNFILTDEEKGFSFYNFSVSPDFTSFFQGMTEYTYHADFTTTESE